MTRRLSRLSFLVARLTLSLAREEEEEEEEAFKVVFCVIRSRFGPEKKRDSSSSSSKSGNYFGRYLKQEGCFFCLLLRCFPITEYSALRIRVIVLLRKAEEDGFVAEEEEEEEEEEDVIIRVIIVFPSLFFCG